MFGAKECRAQEAESLEQARQANDAYLGHLHETIAKQWRLLAEGFETRHSNTLTSGPPRGVDHLISGANDGAASATPRDIFFTLTGPAGGDNEATDSVSGATNAASAALAVIVDSVLPAAPVISSNTAVNGNEVSPSGTALDNRVGLKGDEVKIYDGSTLLGSTNASGEWSYTTSPLATGSHALTGTKTDVAGNTSAALQAMNDAICMIVDGGTYQYVLAGDTASDTTLSSSIQYDFGTTNDMVISGGYQVVEAGGIAIDTTLSGGDQYVLGTATRTTVNSKSVQFVESGGTASDTTLSGGSEIVAAGATVNGTITFAGSGQLTLEQSTNVNNFQIAGFNAPSEKLDLADITFGPQTTVAFSEASNGTSGTLTVSDGVHTANVTLLGQYTTQNFTTTSDGHGGTLVTDPPTLPAGVTLQQIAGGPNYYGNNGFTYAAAAGWDSSNFFPVGPWLAPLLDQSAANRWLDLGLNTAFGFTGDSNLALMGSNGISAILANQDLSIDLSNNGGSFGPELVGELSYDEPSTFSQGVSTPLSTTPNSVQDGRFWWINFTDAYLIYGPVNGTPSTGLFTPITTPNGSQAHIDDVSVDMYWFAGAKSGVYNILGTGGILDNLGRAMTPDEAERGSNYGDMIDIERAWTGGTVPLFAYIEDGGPYTTDTSASDYITPPELNWAVWSSLIHGARGIVYFNHTFAGPAQSLDNLAQPFYQTIQPGQTISIYNQVKATDALIEQLAPVLNSPFALNYVTVNSGGYTFPIADKTLGGIEVMAKDYNGQFYIFADTRDSETQTNISATFTIADKIATSVTVVNENRSIPVVNGVFTDTFAYAWTVHIYQVNDGSDSSSSSSGTSSMTETLTDGVHNFTATDTLAGSASSASSDFSVPTDTVAPTAPIITSDVTNSDNSASITGTALDHGAAEAGDLVKIYDGSTLIGTAATNLIGEWAYTTKPLSDGFHALSATVTDLAGNTSAPSLVSDATVDPLEPPVIASFSTNTGSVDSATNASSLTLAAEPNSRVSVYEGSTLLGTAPSDGSGAWTFVTSKLADGTHAFTAIDTDQAGGGSVPSAPFNVAVDTIAPMDNFTNATQNSNGLSNSFMPGTAPEHSIGASGDVVKVYEGSSYNSSTAAGSNASWSCGTLRAIDGSHLFTGNASDVAGLPSTTASPFNAAVITSPSADAFTFTGTSLSKWTAEFWPHDLDSFEFSNQNHVTNTNISTPNTADIVDYQNGAGTTANQGVPHADGVELSHLGHHWDLV
jgi:autotransporter passenger strand-loop-strand repeat protein